MSNWNQPICERCWIEAEAVWVTDLPDGRDRLESIRFPVRLTNPTIEQCAWCGQPTIIGAYKRADPRAVPYPAHIHENDPERCPERDGREHLWIDDPPHRVRCIECGTSRDTLRTGTLP